MAAMDTLNEEFLNDYENRCFQDQLHSFRETKLQLHSERVTNSETDLTIQKLNNQLSELDDSNRIIKNLNSEYKHLKSKELQDEKDSRFLIRQSLILLENRENLTKMLSILGETVETDFSPAARIQGDEKMRIHNLLSKSKFILDRSKKATKCLNSIKMELLHEETDQGDDTSTSSACTTSIVATSGATELMTVGEESPSGTEIKKLEEDALNVAFLFDYEKNGFVKLVEIIRHQNRQLHSALETAADKQEEVLRMKNKLSEVDKNNIKIHNLKQRNEKMKKKAMQEEKKRNCLNRENAILWEDRESLKEVLRDLAMMVETLLASEARILEGNGNKRSVENLKCLLSQTSVLLKNNTLSTSTAAIVATELIIGEETPSREEQYKPPVLPLAPSSPTAKVSGIKKRLSNKKCAPQNAPNLKRKIITNEKKATNSGTNVDGPGAYTFASMASKPRSGNEAHARSESLLDNGKRQRELRRNFPSGDSITKKSKLE